jgi:hypothetical protein
MCLKILFLFSPWKGAFWCYCADYSSFVVGDLVVQGASCCHARAKRAQVRTVLVPVSSFRNDDSAMLIGSGWLTLTFLGLVWQWEI